MRVIGVTGNIACGKSTVARQFGYPVFDADKTVHQLLAHDKRVIKRIAARYPEVYQNGALQRPALAEVLYNSKAAKYYLESLLHPAVIIAARRFTGQHRRAGRLGAVLDVPLLFESGMHMMCDCVVLADSHRYQQRKRLTGRGIALKRQQQIIRQQAKPGWLKRRATRVINTSRGSGLRRGKGLLKKAL